MYFVVGGIGRDVVVPVPETCLGVMYEVRSRLSGPPRSVGARSAKMKRGIPASCVVEELLV